MSVIMTFMFEPAKLQMNWAKARGTSIARRDGLGVFDLVASVIAIKTPLWLPAAASLDQMTCSRQPAAVRGAGAGGNRRSSRVGDETRAPLVAGGGFELLTFGL